MNYDEKVYIGVLATEKEIRDSYYQEVVFINEHNDVQYTVKSMSVEQLPQQYFTGHINCFDEACDLKEDYYASAEDRIESFRSEVEDKLFMFSYGPRDKKYYNILDAQLVAMPESFDRNEKFVAVPVFSAKDDQQSKEWEHRNATSLYKEYTSYGQFVERIQRQQYVGRVIGYDAEGNIVPPFVVWKEADGALYAVSAITRYDGTGRFGVTLKAEEISCYSLDSFERDVVFNEWINPTILFLPQRSYQHILEYMRVKQYSPCLTGPVQKDKEEDTIVVQYEDELLSSIKYHSQKMNLQYKESDLVNFHTAVKCSNLVVLSGMSGTGKSALVDVYAKALGISSENKQFLCIPVSPSWNDDADLLGHIDLVNMVYHASDTGFVNILVEAQKEENQDKLYFVCFDEMNLARVEHYFSQFLSILEKPVEDRSLILYDEQYRDKLDNAAEYPWKIAVGDNIKFIGTVNIDESTYHFSDKVLDRANVITLDIMNYSQLFEENTCEIEEHKQWTASEYRAMVSEYSRNQELRCLLWDIHEVLQKANVRLGIGPRIVKSMEQYLCSLPKGKVIPLTMNEAIDYQIVQRVLTKVRGPENQLGALFEDKLGSGILPILNKYTYLSTFEKSRQILEDKKKELDVYGYCI